MQKATPEYKSAMKQPLRNRGYIKAMIGVVNMRAQENLRVSDGNEFTVFTSVREFLTNTNPSQLYATAEENVSKVNGTMYFEPESAPYYYNGLVTEQLFGSVLFTLNGLTGQETKGLTIDFGEYYPTELTIEYDEGTRTYTNDSSIFKTEDVFDNLSYFRITAISMVNGETRLRINSVTLGIANTFGNHEVLEYTCKDYVSPIADSIPSVDMVLTVDNQSLYYSPDNPESALAYMEQGQEISVEFGYDVDGQGKIEWIKSTKAYLKTWSADDVKATFSAVDIFDYALNDKYYGGVYNASGITLYDLATEVLTSAGIEPDGYYLDPYLRKVTTRNPIPAVPHSQALQIIANAGRCAILVDRDRRICLYSSFKPPEAVLTVNNKTQYSKIDRLMEREDKDAYAEASLDYTKVDGSMLFMPNGDYLNTGYVGSAFYDGTWDGAYPEITIQFESEWTIYGFGIRFRNLAPQEFVIRTYLYGTPVQELLVQNPELEWLTDEVFYECDKVVISVTKASEKARVFIDSIFTGDVTDYWLLYTPDLTGTPHGTRQNKIRSIGVKYSEYHNSTEELKNLRQTEIQLQSGVTEETIYFTNPSYGYSAEVTEGSASVSIVSSSCYYITLRFNSSSVQKVKYVVKGYEYKIEEYLYKHTYATTGDDVEWSNPLIDTNENAEGIEEWLSSYYLGDVEYDITWRGDPITDANDLFYLEIRNRDNALIKAYQNELKFNGAWSGALKARKMYGVRMANS